MDQTLLHPMQRNAAASGGGGIMIAIAIFVILLIVGVLVYVFVIKKSEEEPEEPKDESEEPKEPKDEPKEPEEDDKPISYTYPKKANSLPKYKQYNCPGASNVLASGNWCQFSSDSDAQKYCSSITGCAGYGHLRKNNTFQVVADDPSFTMTDNGEWDWYPRTTSS
jgi:hypothetical protein